ncbi:hypothetical protein [Adhaeretor mobilis]|nr:hypothetical protein [Adhaeretor mobilis]
MKRKLAYVAVILLLLFGFFLYQLFGPHTKVQLGKSTTFITEPLADDGLPNYILAITNKQWEGVTPENNGALPFCRAMGPLEGMPLAEFALLCNAIGLEDVNLEACLRMPDEDAAIKESLGAELSKNKSSKHWRKIESYGFGDAYGGGEYGGGELEGNDTANNEDSESAEQEFQTDLAVGEFLNLTRAYPWARSDSPVLAQWVDDNQQPLDWLVEAAERPEFFCPSMTALKEPEAEMIQLLLSYAQTSRSAARALATRAQLRIGEGQLDDAWRDTHALFHFGQHVAGGTYLVEQVVALAIHGTALPAHAALLNHPKQEADLARKILADLSALPSRVGMADALNYGERLMFIDIALRTATNRLGGTVGVDGMEDIDRITSKAKLDTNLLLEVGNRWYDRLAEAARLENRTARSAAIERIDIELLDTLQSRPAKILGAVLSRSARSRLVGEIVLSFMLPATNAAMNAEDRGQMQLDLARVATALAIHRLEQGEYPERLADLTPDILEVIPPDLFAGKPLKYERRDEGYLLYSVGRNETDDGGTHLENVMDEEPWRLINGEWANAEQAGEFAAEQWEKLDGTHEESDDMIIRLPLPEIEWKN